jgi:predicted nucleotidyltransferase
MTWRVPPYADAADEAERYVRATYKIHGMVISGSIVRGNAGPTSDLDIFIVHAEPWRIREQKWFHGVPTELFVNPPDRIRKYFESEHEDGKPSTAHMFATGEVLAGADDIVAEIVKEAKDWLAKPIAPTPNQLASKRYEAIDALDNARDAVAYDQAAARLLLADAVWHIAAYAFWKRGMFQPRKKDMVTALAAIDPIAAARVRTFTANTGRDAFRAVLGLANHVLGVDTFFEWSSDRD